jgi:hypothetical protein
MMREHSSSITLSPMLEKGNFGIKKDHPKIFLGDDDPPFS